MIKKIINTIFPKRETTTTAEPVKAPLSTKKEETEEAGMTTGQIWYRDRTNPFHDDSTEIKILEVKEGWAKYLYADIPNAYASTDRVSYLMKVYNLKS